MKFIVRSAFVFLTVILAYLDLCPFASRTSQVRSKDPITLLGSIDYPQTFKGEHKLSVLYKGTIHSIDIQKGTEKKVARGYYELYDSQTPRTLYIVVTEDLHIPEQGAIKYLQTSSEYTYRVFKLKPVEHVQEERSALFASVENDAADNSMLSWDIQELPAQEEQWRLPDATVVLFMNPDFIDHLETSVWDSSRPVVRVPRIVFKKDIPENTFVEVVNKMQLAMMNFKPFHAEPAMKIVPYQNRTVAMPSAVPTTAALS